VYAKSDIDKTTQEVATETYSENAVTSYQKPPKPPASPSGYYGMFELGYGMSQGDWPLDVIRINMIHGYRINKQIAAGLGLGLRGFEGSDYYYAYHEAVIPVFLDLRITPLKSQITPYVALNVGYGFDDTITGIGPYYSGNAGVKFNMGRKSGLFVGVGYEVQQKMLYEDWEAYNLTEVSMKALTLNVGFSF
jgi:hypothetical protein